MSSGLPGVPLGPPLPFPPANNATTPTSPVNASNTPPSPDVASQPSPATLIIPPPSSVNGSSTPPKGSPNNTSLVALGVGIGIGGALVLICVGIFALWYKRRKRRLGLYGFGHAPSSQGPKDNFFGGQNHHWQQNAPPSAENMMRIPLNPSPPRAPPAVTSGSQVSSIDGCTPPLPPSTGGNLSSDNPFQQTTPDSNLSFSRTTFTYQELAFATDNFSVSNLLGQGGFGYVYKGVFRDGNEVAIKQLKAGSGQGEREFQAEVEIISHVHHKHLVSLVGHCISGAQRLLVYEFVPNKTLEFHLHEEVRTTRSKIELIKRKRLSCR